VEYALEEYNRKKGISYSFQKLEEENLGQFNIDEM
jgi:hypothetical protein